MKAAFLGLLVLLLAACTKEPQMADRFTTFTYAETYCSDPWERGTTDSVTLQNLSDYLTAQQIEFMNLGIQKTGQPEVCNACTCKTGNGLSVTFLGVPDSSAAKLQQIGFSRLLDE